MGIGSSLYIDGINLEISNTAVANNSILSYVIENIEYNNTNDDPGTTKNYNLNFKESDEGTGFNTAYINITAVNDAPNAPTSPQCEGQTNPTGVSDFTPEFSWTFSDPESGDTQSAYQIIVGTSEGNDDMWNSSKVSSSSSSDISYAGSDLAPATTYYWKVNTWDNHDVEGSYCTAQTFMTTGPTLTLGNIGTITSDWGRNFNLNHSVIVAVANATNVNVTYNISWLTDCALGTVNKDATEWCNQTVSNSTVQQITVMVNANSTNTSAVNDTETLQINITKREIIVTSHPAATQTALPNIIFYITGNVQGEYSETFNSTAVLLREGIVVGTPKAITDGSVSFNWNESSIGTYNFSIRFYNLTYYFNSSTDNSTVSVENPPPNGGGSSSGGGVGTSDEPENVEETVFLRIYLQAGDSSTYNFNNVVTSVEVTPERTYGLVGAKVEVLAGKPGSITTDPPAGVLFKYVNVFVGTSGWYEDKFSSSVINFQLPASWFEDNNIDPATVTLYRHNGDEWQPLATTMTGQAGGHYQYSAPTPGFSTFMILGQVEESSSGEPAATSGIVADPTPTPETTSDKGIPGFGILLGIMGVLMAVYSRRK